jgi:hypothetical protein
LTWKVKSLKKGYLYLINLFKKMPIFGQTTSDKPRHPSSSWANWKNGKFIAWNRDTQAEEEITLPKEFIVVAESYSIK